MSRKKEIILFDGYCPESKLEGREVRMRLNEMDFWESIETGLQIATFPPYAVVLEWRGEASFKLYEEYADQHHKSLILTKAINEYLPDPTQIFKSDTELSTYCRDIL